MSRRSRSIRSNAQLQPDLFAFGVTEYVQNATLQLVGHREQIAEMRAFKPLTKNEAVGSLLHHHDLVGDDSTRRRSASSCRDVGSAPHSIRIVGTEDLPSYSELDQDVVNRSIADLPPNRIWFTYAAIKECFGVSRATVARKVKEGLVPGIRFRGTSVLEDGPVRRFDRTQLRWLLLAVRVRR